jgi:glycosyltransferase involved in cell wall biosynthesis
VKSKQISFIIPCLNERKTIVSAVADVYHHAKKNFSVKEFDIIVADNGSTDGTLELIKDIPHIHLVHVPIRGYGAALHFGIMNSKSRYILFADADLSYPFSNISRFKKTINQKPDLVLGSRLKGKIVPGAMPFLHRYIGTPLLTWLIRLVYHLPTTDCNSGMRLVKRSFYRKLNMHNSGMEWASELLLKTAINHGKYLEVPIRFTKDKRGKKPHLSTWSDGWRHLKSIFLLKPSSLYPLFIIFPSLSFFFYHRSFGLTFLFLNLTIILFLSLLALELLRAAIEKKPSFISSQLAQFKLVPVTFISSLIIGIMIISIPDNRLGSKLLLVSILSIISMWIFLIETIKTHLVNRLPDV